MEDVTLALNKRLTITDNFDADIKSVRFDGVYPVNLSWDRKSRPTIAIIGDVALSSGGTVSLSNALTLLWEFNQEGEIQINDVVGLDDTASKQYNLKLIFMVG